MKKTNTTLALICAFAIAAHAGAALGNDGGPCGDLSGIEKQECEETSDLSDAWENFLKAMEDVTQQLKESPSYEADPTGLIDIQTGMMLTVTQTNMSSSGSGLRGTQLYDLHAFLARVDNEVMLEVEGGALASAPASPLDRTERMPASPPVLGPAASRPMGAGATAAIRRVLDRALRRAKEGWRGATTRASAAEASENK